MAMYWSYSAGKKAPSCAEACSPPVSAPFPLFLPPFPVALQSIGCGARAWIHPTLSSVDQRARARTS